MDRAGDDLKDLLRAEGYASFVQGHPLSVYAYGVDGRFLDANQVCLDRVRLTREQMEQLPFGETVLESQRERVRGEFATAARGETRTYPSIGVRSDGMMLRSWIINIPIYHDGEVFAVLGIVRDIEEEERNREVRAELEERLSRTLDEISDAIWLVDRDWRFSYVNARGLEVTKTRPGELIGQSIWAIFPNLVSSKFGAAYVSAATERKTVSARDYSEQLGLWLEVTAYPTADGIAVYGRDVTAEEAIRVELEKTQKQSAAQAALLDVARDAMIVRRFDGTITFMNRAVTEMLGWTVDDAIGMSPESLYAVDPREFHAAMAIAVADGAWFGELHERTKTGERIISENRWTVVYDDDGNPESIFSVKRDITQRKREDELRFRTQRMESLGTLAGGIAHDLNNVLTPILMSAQLLAKDETDAGRSQMFGAIEAGVKRGADMIRQVLTFARGGEENLVRIDPAKVIVGILNFCSEALDKNIVLSTDAEEDLWIIAGNRTQLDQVLINLVVNARDAMPQGGELRISARNVELADSRSSVTHLANPGRYVLISVEDTGTGIAPDIISKIFEPFFTTKDVGSGTGLGLATSISIVQSHGGSMQVYSEPGSGSRFDIHLPALSDKEANATVAEAAAPTLLPRGHGELVLVVDDEAAIREMTRQALEAHGYATAVASNGAEALEYLDTVGGAVDLVLTDMMMPVMDGAATAAALLYRYPTVPVIATSGLNANGGVARAASSGVRQFLDKPYTTSELLSAIANALGDAGHATT